MVAIANRSLSAVHRFSDWSALQAALLVLMSRREDIKRLWERDELSVREKFEAYLEGYLMSFDFYPVCERHLFARNDIGAILQDFWAISADVNRGVQDLIESGRAAGDVVDSDEAKQRRVEAARRAIEAIQRARLGRSNKGS
ncbi:MAG: hypothetical protein ACLP7P_16055 [Rhodomicrobium sp.]